MRIIIRFGKNQGLHSKYQEGKDGYSHFCKSDAVCVFEGISDRSYVGFSQDGEMVIIRNFGMYVGMLKNGMSVTKWSTTTGQSEVLNFVSERPVTDTDYVYSVDISPDKKKLLTVSAYGKVIFWDIQARCELKGILNTSLESKSDAVTEALFMLDNQSVMLAGNHGIFHVDVKSGRILKRFEESLKWGNKITISQNKAILLVGSGTNLILYDIVTGEKNSETNCSRIWKVWHFHPKINRHYLVVVMVGISFGIRNRENI